jgi:PST family polysaccharide transporter
MRKILNNLSWLVIGRVFQLLISATVGVMVARHLGPEDFGRISFAIAFVSIFAVVIPLGMPAVLTREIVRDLGTQTHLLAVASAAQAIVAFFCYITVIFVINEVAPSDKALLALAVIYGVSVLSKPLAVYRTWFEATLKVGYVVQLEMAVLAVASVLNIAAIFFEAEIWVYVAIQAALAGANNIGVALFYRFLAQRRIAPSWDFVTMRRLLSQSWPMMISAIGLVLYLKIDQVMLGSIADSAQVGLYSAGVKLSEVWYALPMMLMSTLFPAIVRAHETSVEFFEARVTALLELFNGLSICIALVVSLMSGWLVTTLFGSAYDAAGAILSLHVWAAVFVFMGTLTGKWYYLQGIQRWNIFRNFLGAGVNIALNVWAIPIWGAKGAALATLISYMVANFLVDAFVPKARPLFAQKVRSFFSWPRLLWQPKRRLMQLSSKGSL